jgi:hypothetical protein
MDRTGWTEQAEQTGRTGVAEKDRQNRTARQQTERAEQN